MADYFVASGGSNTSPYDTWAKAATSLATALAAATASGDRVIIQYDGVPSTDSALAADTTYTAANNIAIISSTNSGTATVTPTVMNGSTANQFIGHSSNYRTITLVGAYKVYVYGVAFLVSGSNYSSINISPADGFHYEFNSCKLWTKNNAISSYPRLGPNAASTNGYIKFNQCDFWFAHASQGLFKQSTKLEFIGCTINASSTAPTTLVPSSTNNTASSYMAFEGCDLSKVTGTLVGNQNNSPLNVWFANCKLGAGVTPLATQIHANLGAGECWLYNCASGDTHYHIAHYNPFGSTVIDTGIYSNDGATPDGGTTRTTWKVSGTSAASYYTPYISPWIDRYHSGTSAITPYLECLRDNSSGAVYTDDQVWSEWSYQGTSGYTLSTIVSDRMALAGTPADQTASGKTASDWTGETGTPGLFKLQPTSTITPAEIGHLRARVCVGGAYTVYVDPQIRGT